MNTFSVVIPTLWRCNETLESIRHLIHNPHVSEIIIIDNDRQQTPEHDKILLSDRVKLITPHSNLYVGESWNLGTRMAKENLICLLSDDVVLHDNVLVRVQTLNFNEIGVLGLSEGAVSEHADIDYPIKILPTDHRTHGYGVCMFYHRKHYVNIPSKLKIFFTDDWIFAAVRKHSGKANYILDCSIRGRMSVTSQSFNYMFHSDGEAFAELMRDF